MCLEPKLELEPTYMDSTVSIEVLRGVIQINPEYIYISATNARTRIHLTRKHHRPIRILFYYTHSGRKTNINLSTVLQSAVVFTIPAKTAITAVQNVDHRPH
jgi:hypothetical protein